MKVKNMTSSKGNKVANQFIVEGVMLPGKYSNCINPKGTMFQSYKSCIAFRFHVVPGKTCVVLDETYWNYSVTTSRYRNQFLNETTQETQRKINSGEYKLADLN